MEKRYQVFISSTFQDLQPARQEVSQALLRADCFPAGMELFPAADEEQFAFIKQIIDQSDYYIIISAGRYGSIHPETGLSYTEMEYDYAVETGKPVIRLLHKDPFNQLRGEFIEQTDLAQKNLNRFREKMSKKNLVDYWEDPKELGFKVFQALNDIENRFPAKGWVRSSEHNNIWIMTFNDIISMLGILVLLFTPFIIFAQNYLEDRPVFLTTFTICALSAVMFFGYMRFQRWLASTKNMIKRAFGLFAILSPVIIVPIVAYLLS